MKLTSYVMVWHGAKDELEQHIPSSTISPTSPTRTTNPTTQKHSRQLRRLLERLDDLERARRDLVKRADRLADADDITPRISKEAAKLENILKESMSQAEEGGGGWVEVRPEMLEGELEDELMKFEKFGEGVRETEVEQGRCLSELEVRYFTRY